MDLSKGLDVGTGDEIDISVGPDKGTRDGTGEGPGLARERAEKLDEGLVDGAGLDEGPGVGTNDGPGFAEGLGDKLDTGLADGAGLREGQSVGTNDGRGLAEGLAELEERRSEVEAMRAELNEVAEGR